ncbi:MAG: class I SAM-dependent methyltransferase [Candidatus Binataceae bacterium]|jgi:tRNA (cmo5U34)-methyltransferase
MTDDVFSPAAHEYDQARRQLVPCFGDFYRTAVELIPFPRDSAAGVLDLGAGTGLLSGFIAAAFPAARITLIDVSAAMLERARECLAGYSDRTSFIIADLNGLQIGGIYDAIVSALAIHHLEHTAKRELFKTIFMALKPGGMFVNAEQVLGSTPAVQRRYRNNWLRRVRALGVSEDDLAAAFERMKLDCCATAEAQVGWLSDAGFIDADCAYKDGMFAVIGASKPAP